MDNVYSCKGGIIKSETLPDCPNISFTPKGFNGPLVCKIPVVLAEPEVQVDVESVIQLEESAYEIKRIKKNLFVTQCKLVNIGDQRFGKLFLSGYVRKNIEYSTVDCRNECENTVSGRIKHTTVYVPFSCVTKVKFDNPPKFHAQGNTHKIASFMSTIKGSDYCDQKVMGDDPCEQSFHHTERFNEKVFCELEEANIYEDDIIMDPKSMGCGYGDQYTFDKIVEKMVIFVRLKLLQHQQVSISGKDNHHFDKDKKNACEQAAMIPIVKRIED